MRTKNEENNLSSYLNSQYLNHKSLVLKPIPQSGCVARTLLSQIIFSFCFFMYHLEIFQILLLKNGLPFLSNIAFEFFGIKKCNHLQDHLTKKRTNFYRPF